MCVASCARPSCPRRVTPIARASRRVSGLALLALLPMASQVAAVAQDLDGQDGWQLLFNGVDLSGWRIHGTELWYVDHPDDAAQGELVCESGPDAAYGYLATEREYRDFELVVEFKQEADGNSGVFFRSSIEGTRITGWQAEVAPPGSFTGGIYESYGRGWLIQPEPAKDGALRMGEWNEMRLLVVAGHVTTWLNGVEMIDLTDDKIGAATGSIALQIHDGGGIKVRWRGLRIRERSLDR